MPDATGAADVAVIGAGGATGGAVVAALGRRGAKVRALLHRNTQKALFSDLEDFALVEMDDPSSLTPAMVHHLRKSRVELAFRESSLAWTILQPAMYVQTPYAFLSPGRDALTPSFDVRKPFTPVDLQDPAEAAPSCSAKRGIPSPPTSWRDERR